MRSLAFAVALVVVASARPAAAQGDYPRVVQDHLGLKDPPPCSLCHAKGNTGSGTVTTPFGWSMRGKGLAVEDTTSVTKALDALRDARTDSDGDGVPDVDELIAGTDPNSNAAVAVSNEPEPGYGCGGTAPSPRGGRTGLFSVGLPFALATLFVRRRASARK